MIKMQYMEKGSDSGIARFYEVPNPGPLEDYILICLLNWKVDDPNKDVWIHGLMGKGNRKFWRMLVQQCHEMGFLRIRALRKEGRILPRATLAPDGSLIMMVSDFIQEPPDSSFDPL